MKGIINGSLNLNNEQRGLSTLIEAAKQLLVIRDEIESVINSGKFENGIYDDELSELAYALSEKSNALVPIIGTVVIGSTYAG